MDYYVTRIKYKNKEGFYLWYSDNEGNDDKEVDKFLKEDGKLLRFTTIDLIMQYGTENSLNIMDEGSSHASYIVRENIPVGTGLDCRYFIDIWNLVTDICATLDYEFWGDAGDSDIERLYKKIFWGCNLPAITPEGKCYIPNFDKKEEMLLRKLYKSFVKIVRKAM